MSYMKPTITVRLPEDLRAELEDIAKAEEKPLSGIVRDSIRRYVAIYRFRRLRNKVLPFAEAQGLLTDEDVSEALT
jgi:predicted transcriptional regulator